MRATSLFSLALTVLAVCAKSVDIHTWPLSVSKSQLFATISYDTENATIVSYKPFSPSVSEEVVRIGFTSSDGKWSGVATSAENFRDKDKALRLQLLVGDDATAYHVGFRATRSGGVSQGSPESSKDGLSVEVVKMQVALPPLLNKPVVVSQDGQADAGKEPEKTFLQKYWWAIGLFLLLQVVMAGGKDDEAPKK